MSANIEIPHSLERTLKWFAGIITQPIDQESRINPISFSGEPIEAESALYIAPSPSLKPHQRIELYNQQYWWRLLNAMQENFPLVTRLFGYADFNQIIAFPYLSAYPPSHWSLSKLGDYLPKWIEENYFENDKKIVLESASVDLAFLLSFVAKDSQALGPSPKEEDLEALMDQILYLPGHLFLFELDSHLFRFRQEMVKQPVEYWTEHDFPPLEKDNNLYCFVLYRSPKNSILLEEVSWDEMQVLKLFKNGNSLNRVCEMLEKNPGPLSEQASLHLSAWISHWVSSKFLTKSNG